MLAAADALEIVSGCVPQLVMVIGWSAKVPTGTEPKVKPTFGLTHRAGVGTVVSTIAT
jgi:hypothetical protein